MEDKIHSAVVPVPNGFPEVREWYWKRHEEANTRLRTEDPGLLFVGDSIMHGWDDAGRKYRDRFYSKRRLVNLGFGWDRIQHVLWRLDRLDFRNASPRLAVVLIGTNNSNGNDNTAREIADGIIAVCGRLRTYLPAAKILLIGIFPREPFPCAQRDKIAEANRLASAFADGATVRFLDLREWFLRPGGSLDRELFPDNLHPSEKGYAVWAEAMEPSIAAVMDAGIE